MSVKITLGFLITIFTGIFGFAAWMTVMQSTANANSDSISKLQSVSNQLYDALISIDKRLSRIEILLEKEK